MRFVVFTYLFLANGTNEKLLNELSIKKTYLVAFLGNTDATGTT